MKFAALHNRIGLMAGMGRASRYELGAGRFQMNNSQPILPKSGQSQFNNSRTESYQTAGYVIRIVIGMIAVVATIILMIMSFELVLVLMPLLSLVFCALILWNDHAIHG
jgi:hypothetical protein